LPNVQAGWIAAKFKKLLVLAPRGMLGPAALNFSRAKKLYFDISSRAGGSSRCVPARDK
jgi:hypothetical protein